MSSGLGAVLEKSFAMKIAICFFGITRSLRHTFESISSNLLKPCRDVGDTENFCHFFQLGDINNPRSGERGELDRNEYKLLSPDWLQLDEPDQCLENYPIDRIFHYGDYWGDDFKSLRNLLHQLHSIKTVTQAVQSHDFDLVIFARPDLLYHDSIRRPLLRVVQSRNENEVCVPDWQHWEGGLNDRFAICKGADAIHAYGCRVDEALSYCEEYDAPLHAEKLLKFALDKMRIPISTMTTKASRVRFDGTMKEEVFWSGSRRLERLRRLFSQYCPPMNSSQGVELTAKASNDARALN